MAVLTKPSFCSRGNKELKIDTITTITAGSGFARWIPKYVILG